MTQRPVRKNDFFKTLMDSIPFPVFAVSENLKILESNLAASSILKGEPDWVGYRQWCAVIRCIHFTKNSDDHERDETCRDCKIRNSVNKTLQNQKVLRQKHWILFTKKDRPVGINMLVTTAPFEYKHEIYSLLMLEDVNQPTDLGIILAICTHCKKFRNDQGSWEEIELYFHKVLNLQISHGICPKCIEKHYSEFNK
jgi:hypothetical protein